jgi:hypothetical protein
MSDSTYAVRESPAAPHRPDPVAVRARLGVFGVFWLCGVICALWSAALPSVNARLGLGETRLGSVLLLTGIGAMAAMPAAGRLCDRWTSRPVTRVAATAAACALVGPSLAPTYASLLVTVVVFGASLGVLDVAMNVQAVEVEQRYHRPILSAFHGTWSLGGVVGGAVIAFGLHVGADIRVTMTGGTLAAAILFLGPGRLLLTGTGSAPSEHDTNRTGTVVPLRRTLVLLLGLLALAAYIAEGAATDWAALHAGRVLHADSATAPLAYTIFAATMTVARLGGDRVHNRLGAKRTLRAAGLTTTAGYALVLLTPFLPADYRSRTPAGHWSGWASRRWSRSCSARWAPPKRCPAARCPG